jgi:hypothetical protein
MCLNFLFFNEGKDTVYFYISDYLSVCIACDALLSRCKGKIFLSGIFFLTEYLNSYDIYYYICSRQLEINHNKSVYNGRSKFMPGLSTRVESVPETSPRLSTHVESTSGTSPGLSTHVESMPEASPGLSAHVESMSEASLRLATHESKAKQEIIFYY